MLPSLAPCHVCAFVHSKRRYFLERRLDMMRGRAGILYRARVGSAIGRVRPTARTGHRHSHPRPRGRAPTRAEDDPVTQWCVLQLVVVRRIAASQQYSIAAAFSVSIAVLDVDHRRNS